MNTLVVHDPTPPTRHRVVRIWTVRRRFRSGRGIGGMHLGRRAGSVAAAIAVLAIASACFASPPDTPPSPTPTTSDATTSSPTSSPSPSPTPTSQTEVAAANAAALIHEYYRVIDELGADPKAPLSRLDSVAISKDLDSWKRQLERNRRDGYVQTGTTRLADINVPSVNLDNSDPTAGRVPAVQVDVCFDVSDVDVRDASGKSVVPAERPATGWIRHTVSNYSWDANPTGGWRVSTSVDLKKAPC